MATEVGSAYVRLIPSMQGFSGLVGKELSRSMPAAGKTGGVSLGGGIVDGVDKQKGKFKAAAGRIGSTFSAGLKTGGLLAGTALAGGILKAFDTEAAEAKLSAQLGGGEWGEMAGRLAGNLYVDGFGDSVGDVSGSVSMFLRSGLVAEDSTEADMQKAMSQFLTVTDVMGLDQEMTFQAADNMMSSGLTGNLEETLDLLTAINQQSLSPDTADVFQEYATVFGGLGLSGADVGGLLIQAEDMGIRDADKAADALKEFGIRGQDMSKTSREAFSMLGIDADTAFLSVAAGGNSARLALGYTLDALREMEDPVARNTAGVALFGTQWEDAAAGILNMDLDTATARLGRLEGKTDDLGAAYETNAQKLENFKRKGMKKLTDFLGDVVIPAFEDAGPKLATAFAPLGPALADLFPVLVTAVGELAPIVGKALEFVTPLVEKFADLLGWFNNLPEGWQLFIGGLGTLAALSGPIGTAVGAISSMWGAVVVFAPKVVGLIAGLLGWPLIVGIALAGIAVVIYKNWDTISGWLSTAWNWLKDTSAAVWDAIKSKITTELTGIKDGVTGAWEFITGLWPGLYSFFVQPYVDAFRKAREIHEKLKTGIRGVATFFKNRLREMATAARDRLDAIRQLWVTAKARIQNLWSQAMAWVKRKIAGAYTYVRSRVDRLIGVFRNARSRISGVFSSIGSGIKRAFRSAFQSVVYYWNRYVGGKGFSFPSWIPGVGGKSFKIPKFHDGGVFKAGAGSGGEGLALLRNGEGIFTPEQMRALGAMQSVQPTKTDTTVVISADGVDRALLEWLRRAVRVEGGNVQQVLGGYQFA